MFVPLLSTLLLPLNNLLKTSHKKFYTIPKCSSLLHPIGNSPLSLHGTAKRIYFTDSYWRVTHQVQWSNPSPLIVLGAVDSVFCNFHWWDFHWWGYQRSSTYHCSPNPCRVSVSDLHSFSSDNLAVTLFLFIISFTFSSPLGLKVEALLYHR